MIHKLTYGDNSQSKISRKGPNYSIKIAPNHRNTFSQQTKLVFCGKI